MALYACSSQEYTTAKLALQQSDFDKAAEWLPKAMAVEPDNPEIPIVMAVEIHAENEKWSEMVNLFNKAMDINSEKVIEIRGSFISVKDAVNNYTEFYWAQEFNKGVEQFKKIQNDSDNKIKYLDVAINHFKNSATIKPSDANTYTTLAKCYLDKDDKTSAKDAVIIAVIKNPESFDANFSAGQILGRTGLSSKEILPYYKKAVEIEPSNSKALRELAGTYYDIGEKEESIKIFTNAIKNENDKIIKADLYYNLGVIHNQMKNYQESENAFDEAVFHNDKDYEAMLGMVKSYENIAAEFFQSAEFGNAYKWYRKAEKKLKNLRDLDFENESIYDQELRVLRQKRDHAEGQM
tara:strand:+ start:2267 stop:3319 length:1053 start_codon:yes stop_codon:yes gene_type:complete